MKHKIFAILMVLIFGLFVTNISTVIAKDKKDKIETVAVISTDKGDMKAVLEIDKAPITTENFIKLAKDGFYKDMKFHRVVEDFVIQTGDPTGTGSGGSDKTIPLEIHKKLKHKRGAVAMARKADPDSATSQFYITISKQPDLDGKYAVFGHVYEGMDVIDKIKQGDKLNYVEIIEVPKSETK
ncbi:MAG: peptidylprolyl isomerase [Cyanobacteriota bacterium]